MKQVKNMYRPELVMFIYSYQELLFKEESSLQEIKELDDTKLYEIAYQLEKLIS